MRVFVLSDIHEDDELFSHAIEIFSREKCDLMIQTGDLLDSENINSDKGMACLKLSANLQKALGDKYVQLLGNHELAYFYDDNRGLLTSKYSPLKYNKYHTFLKDHKDNFKFAYQIDNYLFTHAGVTANWFIKHYSKLKIWADHIGLDIENTKNIGQLINAVGQTCDFSILFNRSKASKGDHIYSGPLWADKSELVESTFVGLHQVVGHNTQSCISTHYVNKNTSVTFTDCLPTKDHFLILNI